MSNNNNNNNIKKNNIHIIMYIYIICMHGYTFIVLCIYTKKKLF